MNKYEKMYEDILLACRTGEVVIVEDKDGEYRQIRYLKDNLLVLGKECDDLQDCKNHGTGISWNKREVIELAKHYEYKIVETYVPEYDRVPVGTKVLITDQNDEATGSICTIIEQIDGTQYGIERPDRYLPLCLPRSAFTVILPEEEAVKFNNDIVVNCPPIKETPKTITLDGVEYILTPKK